MKDSVKIMIIKIAVYTILLLLYKLANDYEIWFMWACFVWGSVNLKTKK